MIYTVTLNPAMDYAVTCPGFEKGGINLYTEPYYSPGGKGINVSLLLGQLGTASLAMGLCAGFTGGKILEILEELGINHDFLMLKNGISRINFKVCSENETEINGAGPIVSAQEAADFLKKFGSVKKGDTLVLAGSLPASMPEDYYESVLSGLDSGIMTVIDATGKRLTGCLKYAPFLIKPNHLELGDIFGVTIASPNDAAVCGKKLIEAGAQNVLVSMGAEGAVLVNRKAVFIPAVKGRTVSACGAGDSMVGGFIYGYSLNGSFDDALMWGTAAGAATAFSKGIAKKELIYEVFEKTSRPIVL